MDCCEIDKYIGELESGLMKQMAYPVNERSASAVDSMVKCWKNITEMKQMIKKSFDFTPEKAEEWLLNMQNEDDTTPYTLTMQL